MTPTASEHSTSDSSQLSDQPTVLSARVAELKSRSNPPGPGWDDRWTTFLERFFRHAPFVSLVPAIVVVFGLAAVVAITKIGVQQLSQQSDASAALRAVLLADTLAARLGGATLDERAEIIERATIRSGVELLLVDAKGEVLVDGTVKAPPGPGVVQLLSVHEGETQTPLGRARFYAAALPPPEAWLSVISFVPAPSRPIATESLIRLVAAFTALLLTIAVLVAFALARDVHSDVDYVRQRIVQMARPDAATVGQTIPVRTVDQVGAMTNAFNELVERFTEAEDAYKEDLQMAVSLESDRSAFLAALSHELKTPLNVILGFADVLLAEVEGPLSEDTRENLQVVRRSGTHLNALIKDILDLSALESGELTLARSMTDVMPIASDVLKEHQVTARQKGLLLKLDGEAAQAWADPVRVRQIIGNLLGNAIKFTRTGGVSVTIKRLPNQVSIRVKDSGSGIAPREQTAIFEDFAQVGDLRARGAGSGLGLAITRRLVQMHGGKIFLKSELGEGAEFTILLPSEPRGHPISRAKMAPQKRKPSRSASS